MAKTSAAEDGINPLEKGRRLYQQEDYDAAIQAFSDVGSLPVHNADKRISFKPVSSVQPLNYVHISISI